ncbi:hypothetical protein DVH24_004948 [Malus domestica]|uniref:RNase H type-1 domain-containing protein n=1 Tax=Malus domestica TaxID=3750 RepID=A0A498IFW2_MALDO|nr:hypothetical protein DVH24_004948 [Malus domestica]
MTWHNLDRLIFKSTVHARFIDASFWWVEWRHTFRETNFVTDALVHFGVSLTSPHIWDHCLPSSALPGFHFDCIVAKYEVDKARYEVKVAATERLFQANERRKAN